MTTHLTLRSAFALAIVTVALLAAAPRASAVDMACNYDNRTFNACLRFDYQGYLWYHGHVGIDIYLPEQYAREIVNCGADFKASLWGDDGGGSKDDFIRNFVLSPGWPTAGTGGMSAEFFTHYLYSSTHLDEDDGTDQDELYAKVSYWDCHTFDTEEFRTGTVRATWW
jgi:hypothetical protein